MLKIPKLSIPKTFTPPFRLVGRQIHSQGYFISLKSQKILYCKLGQGCHFILFFFFFFFFFLIFLLIHQELVSRRCLEQLMLNTHSEFCYICFFLFWHFGAFSNTFDDVISRYLGQWPQNYAYCKTPLYSNIHF